MSVLLSTPLRKLPDADQAVVESVKATAMWN